MSRDKVNTASEASERAEYWNLSSSQQWLSGTRTTTSTADQVFKTAEVFKERNVSKMP